MEVRFWFHTGVRVDPFAGAELVGSWGEGGRWSAVWSGRAMEKAVGEDGCPVFTAAVDLAEDQIGRPFQWGVRVRRHDGTTAWGIAGPQDGAAFGDRHRWFVLGEGAGEQHYHLSRHHWMGAQRWDGDLRFMVWAPNARAVEVVFGGPSGYIADDGHGIDPDAPVVPLTRGGDGLWQGSLPGHAAHVGRHYCYRLTTDDDRIVYRTDMWSREQVGKGDVDPGGAHYDGDPALLDGTPSCTRIVDTAARPERPAEPAGRLVPRRVEDLVIYELHVGALGYGHEGAGTFADAIALLPHLEELGVNAVELLPIAEFNESRSWGYGTSHFLAVESSAGGREALKRFVDTCHERGIAVLMDLVFNHYSYDSARASWQYDSEAPDRNIYYWYVGRPVDHPQPDGGYLDNLSSGFAPRYWEEQVRALFTSSAVMLCEEFGVDGFRFDQTTSIHAYNSLHADGSQVGAANAAGIGFLRELCATLTLLWPDVILTAEDHSGWDAVTRPVTEGGLGFHAAWYSDFYHHLIGDKGEGSEYAKLLASAAVDHHGPLAMGRFAGAMAGSAGAKVVYHENHDEAANAPYSHRTLRVAVNHAPLVGDTRRVAEARARFAFGMSALSAGTPLFLMGEEVGATNAYRYDDFTQHKDDLAGLRTGDGARLFRFYADLIALRLAHPALRARAVEVIHARDPERVLAFRRQHGAQELLVVASLAEHPWDRYDLTHPALGDAPWREVLNSDAEVYGGWNVGNLGTAPQASGGTLTLTIPPMGLLVLRRERTTA